MDNFRTSYIGKLREKVGAQKIIVTSAAACVRDEKGRVLLQERRDNLLWGFPGGVQELGERTDVTVQREVFEETGLKVVPIHWTRCRRYNHVAR